LELLARLDNLRIFYSNFFGIECTPKDSPTPPHAPKILPNVAHLLHYVTIWQAFTTLGKNIALKTPTQLSTI